MVVATHRDEVGSDSAAQPSVQACGFVGSLAKFGSPFRQAACRTGCGETDTVRGNQNVVAVGSVAMGRAMAPIGPMAPTGPLGPMAMGGPGGPGGPAFPGGPGGVCAMKRMGLATLGGLGDMWTTSGENSTVCKDV